VVDHSGDVVAQGGDMVAMPILTYNYFLFLFLSILKNNVKE
jgi:hypothetical protein